MNSRRPASCPYARRGVLVRLAYLLGSMLCWVVRRARSDPRSRAVVLCYHNVSESQRSSFAWQMRQVAIRAVRTDLLEGTASISHQPVCVTFDDAFAELLDNAIPELEDCGVPATIFAVSGNPGRLPQWEMPPDHPDSQSKTMTSKQLIELDHEELFSVESHTASHVALDLESPRGLRHQLSHSRSELEGLLGRAVRSLALPYGRYNASTLEAARGAGYTRVYALGGKMTEVTSGFSLINRFAVSPDMWRIEFLLTASGAYGWLHGWHGMLKNFRSWTVRGRKTLEIAEARS